jgi:hypothetical protein
VNRSPLVKIRRRVCWRPISLAERILGGEKTTCFRKWELNLTTGTSVSFADVMTRLTWYVRSPSSGMVHVGYLLATERRSVNLVGLPSHAIPVSLSPAKSLLLLDKMVGMCRIKATDELVWA